MTSPKARSAKVVEADVERFLARFTPEVAAVARASRRRLQRLLPGAVSLVYDNYQGVAIGFGASEKALDAPVALGVFPKHAVLVFLRGATLPDPQRILRGGGKLVRNVILDSPTVLDRAEVRALIAEAVRRAPTWDPSRKGVTIVRSVSAKQRPRRPAAR